MAVLLVAIIALRNPKQTATQAGSATVTTSRSLSAAASSSSSPPLRSSTHASTSTSSSPQTSTRTRPSTIGSQPLIVLNNTSAPDLAREAAQRFTRAGWHVTHYDDYRNNIISTAAYYDPSVAGAQAAALALQKQFPTIKRVLARFPQLPAGPVVVVLDSDYVPD